MIRYEVGDDHVGRITLDRPEAKNALTVEMRDDLVDVIRRARDDDAVRALLITGVDDSFCAGMDLRASTVSQAGGAAFNPRSTSEALRKGVQTFIRELWELDKPTVARLTQEEIDSVADSPYNTYTQPGLPPGPIESPGDEAIAAAAHPAEGDWLFYVTVNLKTAETKFTDSYDEFLSFKQELDDYCATQSDRC